MFFKVIPKWYISLLCGLSFALICVQFYSKNYINSKSYKIYEIACEFAAFPILKQLKHNGKISTLLLHKSNLNNYHKIAFRETIVAEVHFAWLIEL